MNIRELIQALQELESSGIDTDVKINLHMVHDLPRELTLNFPEFPVITPELKSIWFDEKGELYFSNGINLTCVGSVVGSIRFCTTVTLRRDASNPQSVQEIPIFPVPLPATATHNLADRQ